MTRSSPLPPSLFRRVVRGIGPGIIVACVVIGPGSILASSRVGCEFGYQLTWVVLGAGMLMAAAVATTARVGVELSATPCTEIARRLGRPFAALCGASVFGITACFQFSNNQGVLAAIEPLAPLGPTGQAALLVGLNGALAGCLFLFKAFYPPLERIMMVLVALMLLGFVANLALARPSPSKLAAGCIPSIPVEMGGRFLPYLEATPAGNSTPSGEAASSPAVVDRWLVVQGLVATTFSIAGAFYQAYLVREKGWGAAQLRQGLVDSAVGSAILVGISATIMATSAAVLAGRVAPHELRSAADVARQLEPLFGSAATWLFCLGVFAGAASSFLVNSVIGGTMLADGLGLDPRLDSPWTKAFTIAVLSLGMFVAIKVQPADRVGLIVFAQALTALGGPALAFALVYLGWNCRKTRTHAASQLAFGLTIIGAGVITIMAVRTLWRLGLSLGAG